MSADDLKIVALVGRPNVGKSTLFNRIAGKRIAVVSDVPGVTRDRISVDAEWEGRRFMLVDTGGITLNNSEPLWEDIRQQTEHALRQADAVVLVTDVREGVTAADADAAGMVRRFGKPIVVAANKAESKEWRGAAAEFHRLGAAEVFPIAALHGIGVDDLMKTVVGDLPAWQHGNPQDGSIKVAIVGKPNTGKSRLLNSVVQEDRVIVSDLAGTTRDSVDSKVEYNGTEFTFIDTAGIRRRGKIKPGLEQFAVLRTLYAIERADVCMVVLGVDDLMTAQDKHIAGYVKDAARACVVVINKWDLARKMDVTKDGVREAVTDNLGFLTGPEVVFTVASEGRGTQEAMAAVVRTYERYSAEVSEYELNKVLAVAVGRQAAPARSGKRPRITRGRQEGTAPPVLVFQAVHPELIHFSYRRYIENQIREAFDFAGTPIVMRFINEGG